MKSGQVQNQQGPADRPDRRLLGGLLVSLLLHAIVLLLQFGVPGLGAPGTPPPLTVVIAQAGQAPATPPVLVPPPALPSSDNPLPVPPRATTGMRLVDPVAAPVAAPEPASVPAAVKARPKVRKDKPRRAKRISSPLLGDTVDDSVRVIAQDSTLNEFNVPLARPEEAQEKSVDVKEAQDGDDNGEAAANAALEAEAAIAGKLKAEEEEKALKLAEQEEEKEKERERERLATAERQSQAVQEEQKKLEVERRQAVQLAQQEQLKKTENDAAVLRERQLAEQREQQKLEQQRAEQLKQEQQRQELAKAAQQRAEQQLAEQQRAEQQRSEQQRVEQQRAEQQRAEQQRAEQQRAEQQRAEQQRAEQQRAEQQRAGEQAAREAARRSSDVAGIQPGSGGTGGPAAGAGGGPAQIPKNMMGSDAANRARDMVRGLDLLRGAPPAPRARGDRRIAVGAGERDLPLKMYAESWRQKIERNGAVNYPRSWADVVRIDPLVSVAVRSDGSVEDVTIIVSSGRAEMDEAVRRIVRVNARYSPFPPQIAERYDVIEIRRVWRFDDQLRLLEEVR